MLKKWFALDGSRVDWLSCKSFHHPLPFPLNSSILLQPLKKLHFHRCLSGSRRSFFVECWNRKNHSLTH